jgi:hypothetical protein
VTKAAPAGPKEAKMSTQYAKDFTILGDLSIQSESWEIPRQMKGAQVLCFADVECNGHRYDRILLLQLEILGCQEDGWEVHDSYTYLLPYMKNVPAFREHIAGELRRYANRLPEGRKCSPWDPVWMGIVQYTDDNLFNFDDTKALLGQLRSLSVSNSRTLPKAVSETRGRIERETRAALKAFGVTPVTDRAFVARACVSE